MPLIAVRKQDEVIRSLYHKVLLTRFPGYGFLELGPTDRWREPFQDMAGKPRILLGADGRPARIPTGEIERHMLDDDRLCDLTRGTMPPFKVGDRVFILEGAFSSHEGTVLDCDGLVTTVEVVIFNRPMPYRMDRAAVEAV
jgi:transcription antitermination factor NusG